MADYDLGTAHGKIVIDYKDKGTGDAGRDLDNLRSKAKALLTQFKETSSKYIKEAGAMASQGSGLLGRLANAQRSVQERARNLADDITTLSRTFGILAGSVAVAVPLLTRTGSSLEGANHIVRSFGLALGAVPKGAENFPDVIKKIIQVSAAVSLFAASTRLLAASTARFRIVGTMTGLLSKFGGTINSLAGPLHAISGIAGSVAFQILQFRFAKAAIKPLLLFGGALAAVGGSLHVIAGLAVSVKDLSGGLLLLPAALGAAGLAFAALKIGVSGLGDAFKALDDPAKFAEALKNLAPSAREFAIAVRDIYNKGFKELKLDVQQKLFAGLGGVVRDLAETYLPSLRVVLGDIATSFNSAAKEIAEFFTYSAEFGNEVPNDVNEGFALLRDTVGNLVGSLPPLVRAFYLIGRVGTEVLAELTGGARGATERFEEFIGQARASGDLKRWMQGGIQAFRDLWNIIENVGKALGGIWSGLNGGEAASFLGTLRSMTERFNEFIRSAEGQRVLALLGTQFENLWKKAEELGAAFVQYVLPALEKLMPIFAQLSGGVIDGIVTGMKVLGPIFTAIGVALTPIAPLLGTILAGMVSMVVIFGGLVVAAKLVGGAIFLLKTGLDTVRTAWAVAGFAARLFTGNLKAQELQALRLAGVLGKNLVKGVVAYVKKSALIKGLGVAAVLGATAYAMDQVNVKAAGGVENLGMFEGKLHDIVEAGKLILNGDFSTIGQQMSDQFKQVNDTWAQGEAPVQKWAKTVATSFQEDFLGPISRLPGQIKGFLAGVGQSFMDDLVTPVKNVGVRIKESFVNDFLNPIKELPGKVGEYLGGLRDTFNQKFDEAEATVNGFPARVIAKITGLKDQLAQKARDAWDGFKQATEQKFIELGGTTGSLPSRIGTAIGSLIGIALKWGLDTFQNFKNGAEIKINEFVTWLTGLPERIGATVSGWVETARTWGSNTFESFKTGAQTKLDEMVTYFTGLPERIGTALGSLKEKLTAKANESFEGFKLSASQKGAEIETNARSLPDRIGGALSALGTILRTRASEAWNNFKAAASERIGIVVSEAAATPGRIAAAISSLAGQLRAKATEAYNSFKASASAKISEIIADARAIPGKITSALGNLGSLLVNAGRQVIDGLLRGIRAGVQAMYDFVSGIAAGIAARKGPISYDKRLLIPAGNAIIQGLRTGLAQELPGLYKMVGGIGPQMTKALNVSTGFNLNGTATVSPTVAGVGAAPVYKGDAPAGGDGSSAPVTNNYHVTLDAKTVAEMQGISDFFGKVQQKARAGKATG